MSNTKDQILISIVVITYNSAEFVIETLESAKAQTYRNIELIISDDCSTDNTVDICKNWLEGNKHYFVNAQLIIPEKNTGIAGNCNRGLKASQGEWVKLIAGDDILLDTCCIQLLKHINNTKTSSPIIISQQISFTDSRHIDDKIVEPKDMSHEIFKNTTPASRQLHFLLKGTLLPGAATFYKRSFLKEIGGFDEAYPMLEDLPTFIRCTFENHRIDSIAGPTIMHRKHAQQVTAANELIVPGYILEAYKVRLRYSRKIKNNVLIANSLWFIKWMEIIVKFGSKGKMARFLNSLMYMARPAKILSLKDKILKSF